MSALRVAYLIGRGFLVLVCAVRGHVSRPYNDGIFPSVRCVRCDRRLRWIAREWVVR